MSKCVEFFCVKYKKDGDISIKIQILHKDYKNVSKRIDKNMQ